ncbi:MAG TPA: flagellar basal body L-ring protein FlgH [Burkholderiaceae bacterium]|nr:flagellar basal body L-ring protein FlgH [Burkholderiaceae bacterium]
MRLFVVLVVLASLAGCSTINDYRVPPVDVGALPPVTAPAAPPVAQANGAIYQAAVYRPLFEDHRARLPGDTLTVQIVEKVSATQKSTSTVDRNGSISGAVTALPGISNNALRRASVGGSSANAFDGKGTTESSNDFSGTITVLVTGVLPNGHLLVQGEKQIGVNANVDVLRFSGQVDPRAIQGGNSVPSTQIANVRVEQRSRGQQADAQVMGLLSRFFLSVMPI